MIALIARQSLEPGLVLLFWCALALILLILSLLSKIRGAMTDKRGKQPVTVELMSGARLRLMPILFHTVIAVMERGAPSTEEPQPPTRDAMVFGGTTEPVEFTSLDDLKGLEEHEDYPRWCEMLDAFRLATNEWRADRMKSFSRLAFTRGIIPVDETDKELSKEQLIEEIGFYLDPGGLDQLPISEVRAIYLEHVAFSTYEEIEDVVTGTWFRLCLPDNQEVEAQFAGFLDNRRQQTLKGLELATRTDN